MEPQVAAIGFSERELMMANAPYAVARYPFADHGKALVIGDTDGFVKLIASTPACEILGAAAVGPRPESSSTSLPPPSISAPPPTTSCASPLPPHPQRNLDLPREELAMPQ